MLTTYEIDFMGSDERLMFSTWLKSHFLAFQAENPEVTDEHYYARQHELIWDIIQDVPVVLDATSQGLTIGWICARAIGADTIVDYCYVKPEFRGFGVAKSLLAEALNKLSDCSGAGRLYSHLPSPSDEWMLAKLGSMGFRYKQAASMARPTVLAASQVVAYRARRLNDVLQYMAEHEPC